MKYGLFSTRGIAVLLAVCVALTSAAVALGGSRGGSGHPAKVKKRTAKSLSIFRRIQKAGERQLLPTNDRMPGVQEFGADPSQARRVDTGEGPPVTVYPGKTGLCFMVSGEDVGAHGFTFGCKPYTEVERGSSVTTIDFDGKTTYLGVLPDRYRSVRFSGGGPATSHHVVSNVYSFTDTGDSSAAEVEAVATDGSRTMLSMR